MIEVELGSTGAAEMSVFHRLLLAKGTNPPRLAFWPSAICWQAVVVPPVPPDPPEAPEPPDPEPLPEPEVELPAAPPLQASRIDMKKNKHTGASGFQGEPRLGDMVSLFFRSTALLQRGPSKAKPESRTCPGVTEWDVVPRLTPFGCQS